MEGGGLVSAKSSSVQQDSRSSSSPVRPVTGLDVPAESEVIWREITARHSAAGGRDGGPAGHLQRPLEAEQGLRRALSRVEAAMGAAVDDGSECSTTGAAEALEELQVHVMHVERLRALSEEVIIRCATLLPYAHPQLDASANWVLHRPRPARGTLEKILCGSLTCSAFSHC